MRSLTNVDKNLKNCCSLSRVTRVNNTIILTLAKLRSLRKEEADLIPTRNLIFFQMIDGRRLYHVLQVNAKR